MLLSERGRKTLPKWDAKKVAGCPI